MATLKLPVFPTDYDHKYNIVLDGETVILEFHYNARADRWSVHFYDATNTAIRYGVRLVNGIDLLQRVAKETKLPGVFTMVDTTNDDLEPTAATLGNELQLRYEEA